MGFPLRCFQWAKQYVNSMLSKYGKVCIIKTSRGCRRRKVIQIYYNNTDSIKAALLCGQYRAGA